MNDRDDHALPTMAERRAVIARELRLMADGKESYTRFTYMSQHIRNLWRAAAELLEES